MATTVVTPAVTVNYSAVAAPTLVVSTGAVAVNYALQAALSRLTVSPPVTVNYTAVAVAAGLYRYIGGQVVRPGLYRYAGGLVTNLGVAAAPPAYPPNYGAVGTYWPGATTTGVPAGTTLTVVNGDLTTSSNNQVIDRIDLRGNLIVKHTGVTFQRGIIRGQATIPLNQSTNIILVDCTDPAVRTFTIQDSEVYCQAPSQWSVGIDGHDWTRLRCNFHDLQDAARYRNRSTSEPSFIVSRWNWSHDFTWFQVATTRAASGQTHNDANQLAGAAGVTIEGDNMDCYYGPNGQRQPTLTTNTSTAWAGDSPPVQSTTTAPEMAGLMLNGSGSQQVTGLVFRKNRIAGAVTPINMGDPLLAGVNIGQITENIFTSDSPANTSNPPKYLRQQPDQTVDWGQGDPVRCNKYADGSNVGQELPVRYDAASSSTPPIAAFTGTPLSGAAPLTVQFTSTSTGNPTTYAWTFGDGATSSAKSPSHTYAAAGTYTVVLTVSNAGGTNAQTRTGYVAVGGAAAATGWLATLAGVPVGSMGTDVGGTNPTQMALKQQWDYWDNAGGSVIDPATDGIPVPPTGTSRVVKWQKAAGSDQVYQKLNRTFTKDNWPLGSPGPSVPPTGSPPEVSGLYVAYLYIPSSDFVLNPDHGWVQLLQLKENYRDSGGVFHQDPIWGIGANNLGSPGIHGTLFPKSGSSFSLTDYMDRWVKWELRVYAGVKDTTGHGGRVEARADGVLIDQGYESDAHVGSAAFSPLAQTEGFVWVVGPYTSNQTTNGTPDYMGTHTTTYIGPSWVSPI